MNKRAKNYYAEMEQAIETFPYFVLNNENIALTAKYKEDIINIRDCYKIYNLGADFTTEGSGGKYIPSQISFKTIRNMINKQARFMVSHMPDINITSTDQTEIENEQIETYKKIINKVVEKNSFGQMLLKAVKDCFIGKRVACLVDMSDRAGIMLHFYTSLEFYHETDYRTNEVTRFISFENVAESKNAASRMFIVNKYVLENEKVYVSSVLSDGSGKVLETYVEYHETDLDHIPVVIVFNDGTLANKNGVSDITDVEEYESGYSKVANAEIDADRKGMNPVIFLTDMNKETTKDLPTGPGAIWDMEHDQTLDEPRPEVGQIAPPMNHTDAVKTVLDRLRSIMHDTMDIPDISKDGLLSGITSFKALKALYYPLMVRCDEKLIVWKPALAQIFRDVIELAILNESVSKELYLVPDVKKIEYNIEIVENYAIIDDETEEKQTDMEEIATNARSIRSYLRKWRGDELKTEDAIEEEVLRIAEEKNMMDTLAINPQVQSRVENQAAEEAVEQNIEEQEIENEEV